MMDQRSKPGRGYLTPAEVASQLGVTPMTILRLCASGEVPGAIPPQREWRIPVDSVPLIPVRKRGQHGPRKKAPG